MNRFRKNTQGERPAISTVSLPDIVFILLFFFMVTTVMREQARLVQVTEPKASEVAKLQNRTLVSQIYIGQAYDQRRGDQPCIQLNDAIHDKKEILAFIEGERSKLAEGDKSAMIVSLKVDAPTEMGIVTDVKQELRRAQALKINYSTRKEAKK